jgi:hypothetical protein
MLSAGDGRCIHHALVRFYAPDELWQRVSVADLYVLRQLVKVYPCQAYVLFGTSSRVYPQGVFHRSSGFTLEINFWQLVDTIQDAYCAEFGKSATAAVLTHCKRDLMHAIWTLLLDAELMHAYVHGIVVECIDGILQRLFPRFFIYSADYPEK